jgi:hypothetical protein
MSGAKRAEVGNASVTRASAEIVVVDWFMWQPVVGASSVGHHGDS